MSIDLGPFSFHLSEKTTRRIIPLLPRDRAPEFTDVVAAIETIEREDQSAKNILQTPLTASRATGT